eukprot:jgi/Mesen1/7813/ME000413S07070
MPVRSHLQTTSKAVGHLQKSAEVMKMVNDLVKAPQVAATMQELSKELAKMVGEAVDDALDTDDIEEETEEEVDRVLTELATETTTAMPSALRRQKVQQQEAAVEVTDREKYLKACEVDGLGRRHLD